MSTQTTLLTSHKGVDLHAASALLVMKDRLTGGDRLVNLYRCELHTFWDQPKGWDMARLLDTGRYFNPNKHAYGHFELAEDQSSWFDEGNCRGESVPKGWPGIVKDTDLKDPVDDDAALYERLLGGPVPDGCTAVDVVSFALGQDGPVLSGVVWRLVIDGAAASATEVAEALAIARSRKEGLLVNPHMDAWLLRTPTLEQV